MRGSLKPRDRRKKRTGPCRIWQLVVHLGYDCNGKRQTLYRTFHGRKSDAQIALDELKIQARAGGVALPAVSYSFEYALERWLSVKCHESTLGEPAPIDVQTVGQYKDYARLHLTPVFGKRRIRDIKNYEVKALMEELLLRGSKKLKGRGNPLAISSVRKIRYVLKSVFEYACEMGWASSNPVARVRLPRQNNNHAYRILDDEEAKRLVNAASSTRLHLVIFIATVTGARRGEILALVWKDIDFTAKTIHFQRGLRHDASTKGPKTSAGLRVINIPDELVEQLEAHRLDRERGKSNFGPGYDPRGFVFANDDGTPWLPNSISTLYGRIVRDAKIGKVKLHELRHSLASILIAEGVDVATVAEILGHSNPAFTLGQYVHRTARNDHKVARVMRRRARAAANNPVQSGT